MTQLFFFSSRRRHTRWPRDWSSDVCSSDLYPWDRLQPQDEMSRHRGAKHRRRYELLGGISLLSPEYLLSVERWPFHSEPPDHYVLLSHLFDVLVSQSSTLLS